MRIFNLSIFISFALLLSSCTSEVSEPDGRRDNVFTLTASMPAGRPETRLALTETDAGDISVKWKEGDKISLCFVSGETVRTLSDIAVSNIREEGKKADFSFSLPEGIDYPFDLYGIYGARLEENGRTATFPASASESGLPDAEPVCVMRFSAENIAAGTPVSVSFTHLGALLGVWLTNATGADYTLSSLFLTGNDGYNWLYNATGQAAYDIVSGTFADTGAGATLAFPLGNGVSIAAGTTAKVYGWIVPGAAPDASKTVTATLNGTAMTQKLPAKAFAAGRYYRLKLWWTGTAWIQKSILFDDFEQEALGSFPSQWVILYNGTGDANQKIVNDPVKHGTQALQLQGATSWSSSIYNKNAITFPNKVVLECYMNLEKKQSGMNASIGLGDRSIGSWGTRTSRILINNGKFYATYYSGGKEYEIMEYVANRWYHIKMEHNLSAKTYKIFIDGTQMSGTYGSETISEFPMHPTIDSKELFLEAGNGGTIKVFFDDVKLYALE